MRTNVLLGEEQKLWHK